MTEDDSKEIVEVLIEIPKGSRNKYEYDEVRKVIRFDRMLSSSAIYPSDYGFIPNTLSLDGDPLDALVLVWESTFPGCLIEVIPIGLFLMEDDKGPDEKILCVPLKDPFWNYIKTTSQVPPHLLREIENFFAIYKELERKEVQIKGWQDEVAAIKAIKISKDRFKKKGLVPT